MNAAVKDLQAPRGRRGWPWAGVLFALVAVGVAVCVGLLATGRAVPWSVIVGLFVISQVAIGAGVAIQGAGLFARPLLGAHPAHAVGKVALTFDDGPDAAITPRVLELLEARGHHATFFVIGARAREQGALLRAITERGHLLGNHSLVHSSATPFVSPRRLAAELRETEQLLEAAGNRSRRHWFRPPVGLLSPRVVEAAERAGMTLVSWTVTARDGIATRPERAVARVARRLSPGAIVVRSPAIAV